VPWDRRGLVVRPSVMKNNSSHCHGDQQQPCEEKCHPRKHPPDTCLGRQNAPFGLETVDLSQDPGQQQDET
jgi:hypothetical protein